MLMDRIDQRQSELEALKVQFAVVESKKVYLTEPQILAFLDYVSETAFDDVNKKRAIINIFVNSIYLYDDHYTLILNTGKSRYQKKTSPLRISKRRHLALEGERQRNPQRKQSGK